MDDPTIEQDQQNKITGDDHHYESRANGTNNQDNNEHPATNGQDGAKGNPSVVNAGKHLADEGSLNMADLSIQQSTTYATTSITYLHLHQMARRRRVWKILTLVKCWERGRMALYVLSTLYKVCLV